MKRFLFVLFIIPFLHANCQYKTATFSDGSTVDYKILSTNPENGPKFTLGIWTSLTNNEGRLISFYNATVYSKYLTASVMYKKLNYGLEFYIPFYHFDRDKERYLSVNHIATGFRSSTLYLVKYPSIIRKYFGIHVGYNRINYTNIEYGSTSKVLLDGLITNEIYVGLGFERKSSIKAEVETRKGLRKTGEFRKFGIYSDVLFCTGTKTMDYSDLKTQPIGGRIYADLNRMWLLNNVYFGLNAKFGMQFGPIENSYSPFVGCGLSFGI